MAFDAHTNLAYSTVAVAPVPDTSGVALTVSTGDGALFPVAPFNCTVWPAGANPLATNAEIVRVTAVVGDVFTIVRAQEGTSARAIVAGDQIGATITVKTITDIENTGGAGGGITIPYVYSDRNDGVAADGEFSWFRGGTWPAGIFGIGGYIDANGVDWTDTFTRLIGAGAPGGLGIAYMRVFRANDPTTFVAQFVPSIDDDTTGYIVNGPISDDYIENPGPDPFTNGDLLYVSFDVIGDTWKGWSQASLSPNLVTATTPFASDASAYDLSVGSRQRVIEILNSNADTSGSGGVPPMFLDILGNFFIVGLGPASEIGPIGSMFLGRNLDGTEGTFQLGGLNLQITSTLQSIGRAWQANHQYYGTGAYDVRVVPTTPNGHIYGTSDTGMSGSSEPTWPTSGGSVVDGALTWNDFGPGTGNIPLYVIGPRSNDGSIYPRVHIAEFWAAYDESLPAWGLGANGEEILWATTPPADAAVANSSRAQYYDDTVGSPKIRYKERDSAGTLKTGYVGEGYVPVGGIIMWSGTIATIPSQWALCDGSANSPGPDLRNQFIVGADADVSGVAKTTLTGSATQSGAAAVSAHTLSTNVAVADHTLTTNVALSAHTLSTNVAIANHTLSTGSARTSTASTIAADTQGSPLTHTITQPVVAAHSITQPVVSAHTITQPVVATHTSNWPAYFALAFIQRMS